MIKSVWTEFIGLLEKTYAWYSNIKCICSVHVLGGICCKHPYALTLHCIYFDGSWITFHIGALRIRKRGRGIALPMDHTTVWAKYSRHPWQELPSFHQEGCNVGCNVTCLQRMPPIYTAHFITMDILLVNTYHESVSLQFRSCHTFHQVDIGKPLFSQL